MTDYSWDNKAGRGEEDAYYESQNNEYLGDHQVELNTQIPDALGEGEYGEVNAQVNMLTPEVVAQAPEVLDTFAGAPVDLDMAQGGVNQPDDMTNLAITGSPPPPGHRLPG